MPIGPIIGWHPTHSPEASPEAEQYNMSNDNTHRVGVKGERLRGRVAMCWARRAGASGWVSRERRG